MKRFALPFVVSCLMPVGATAQSGTGADLLRALAPLARSEQLAFLRTAATPEVVDRATLYVQDERGHYVREREGDNGYSCIIQRGLNGQSVIPRCDDVEGAKALYPTYFLLEHMRAERASVGAYRDSLAVGYSSGRFEAPRHGSFSYMYSIAAYFVADDGSRSAFTPHIMINWPDCRPEDLGVSDATGLRAVHLSLLGMGTAQCHLIVNTPPETGIALAK